MRRAVPVLIVAIAAAGAGIGATAWAAPSPHESYHLRTQRLAHGYVATAGAASDDKQGLLSARSAPPAPAASDPGTANRNQSLNSEAEKTVRPPGGGRGVLSAQGASYAVVPYLNYYASFTGSTSRVAWSGKTPRVADRVVQTDVWRIDYFGDGFAASSLPPGAVAKGDGNSLEIRWTTVTKNAWYSEHHWDQANFAPTSDFGQIYRIRHTVTGTFAFGGTTYTVTTERRAYVW